jgi:hypothetical protein
VAEAQRQLSFRFVHLKSTRTGVLDQLLETYASDTTETPMPIRDWFAKRYDPVAIQAAFDARRARR